MDHGHLLINCWLWKSGDRTLSPFRMVFDRLGYACLCLIAGKPLFLDEWTEKTTRMGFAQVCVLIDTSQVICPGTKIMVDEDVLWQEFIYVELFEICYIYGRIIHDSEACSCLKVPEHLRSKPIYGPWIACSKPATGQL